LCFPTHVVRFAPAMDGAPIFVLVLDSRNADPSTALTMTLHSRLVRRRMRPSLLLDDAAGDAVAGVAGGVGHEVVGLGVDDQGGAAVMEE
jgi:hypothetical protein